MSFSTAAIGIALTAAVVFQGLVIIALLARLEEIRTLLATVDVPVEAMLVPGTAAPRLETVAVRSGRRTTLGSALAGGSLILFMAPKCKTCRGLAADLSSRDRIDDRVVILWLGDADELLSEIGPHIDFATENARRIAAAYKVTAFPTAVLIDDSGAVAGYAHPQNYGDLQRLIEVAPKISSPTSERLAVQSHLASANA